MPNLCNCTFILVALEFGPRHACQMLLVYHQLLVVPQVLTHACSLPNTASQLMGDNVMPTFQVSAYHSFFFKVLDTCVQNQTNETRLPIVKSRASTSNFDDQRDEVLQMSGSVSLPCPINWSQGWLTQTHMCHELSGPL